MVPQGNCPGPNALVVPPFRADCFPLIFSTFFNRKRCVSWQQLQNTHLFDVFGTSDLSKIDFLWPWGPQGSREGPQGGRGVPSAPFRHPYGEICTPHWTSHIPHVCPGGVLPTMRQGLYRMAWSSNPMEVSPLDLRSLTVLPRALLEVSADPPVRRRRQHNNNNPACINSPL